MRQEAANSTKPMQGENSTGDVRPLASLICFLLPKGDASAWHRADADEVWLWHGPASIVLELGGIGDKPDEGHAERHVLGISEGSCTAQLVIPAGTWQRTLASEGEALLSCVVSPGFVYAGFQLAGESPEASMPIVSSTISAVRRAAFSMRAPASLSLL